MANRNIINVSAKDNLKNQSFLSKLSSTLQTRRLPPPEQLETKSSLKWHKTTEVKERIKTATGTIAVYSDMTEEEVEKIKESVAMFPTLEEAQSCEMIEPDIASTVIAEAASIAVQSIGETAGGVPSTIYIAIDDYIPDTEDELPLVSGQKVELIDVSSNKRPRLDPDEGVQLLDNSAAKHKMNIRPKKNHPNPRAKVIQETREERWLVRDFETGKEGMVPSRLLGAAPPIAAFASSIKRSMQEMSAEESKEIKRKLTKEMKEIKSSKIRKSTSRILGPSPEDEARAKRAATIRELIETEEEFVKDLEFVMKHYYALIESSSTPKRVKDKKEVIFGNFHKIAEFHQSVLIEGVKYHAEVPSLIGKTFLRLERDFDMHSEYCSNEPLADQFLENHLDCKDFFEEYSEKIGDDKRIQEHLKLPIQRLNDYQLLLKEIIKFSNRLGDETADLERAHDLMQTIPQRATDAKFLASIEGYKGNLFKLGRLIRHDWFSVSEVGHKTRDRYLFLFKARILITKVKRIGEDRSVFVLKDIIRLPETSLCGLERPRVLEFHHIEPQNHSNFPIILESRNQETRDAWLDVVREHVIDTASVDDLLFDDEIRVISEEGEAQGRISPAADVEDLPEDFLESNQVVPEFKEALERPELTEIKLQPAENLTQVEQSKERVIPIELDSSFKRSLEKEQDLVSGAESSPPFKKRVVSPKPEDFIFEESPKEVSVPIEFAPIGLSQEDQHPQYSELLKEESLSKLEPDFKSESEIFVEFVSTSVKQSHIKLSSESEPIKEPKELSEPVSEPAKEPQQKPKPEPIKDSLLESKQLSEPVSEPAKEPEQITEPELFKESDSKKPDPVKEKISELKPSIVENKSPVTTPKRPKEEEGFDFWGAKESSPPPKKRASSPSEKTKSTSGVLEVAEIQEDYKLEQVEISAFKAEEKVAEQSQDLNLQVKEETKDKVSPLHAELKEEEPTDFLVKATKHFKTEREKEKEITTEVKTDSKPDKLKKSSKAKLSENPTEVKKSSEPLKTKSEEKEPVEKQTIGIKEKDTLKELIVDNSKEEAIKTESKVEPKKEIEKKEYLKKEVIVDKSKEEATKTESKVEPKKEIEKKELIVDKSKEEATKTKSKVEPKKEIEKKEYLKKELIVDKSKEEATKSESKVEPKKEIEKKEIIVDKSKEEATKTESKVEPKKEIEKKELIVDKSKEEATKTKSKVEPKKEIEKKEYLKKEELVLPTPKETKEEKFIETKKADSAKEKQEEKVKITEVNKSENIQEKEVITQVSKQTERVQEEYKELTSNKLDTKRKKSLKKESEKLESDKKPLEKKLKTDQEKDKEISATSEFEITKDIKTSTENKEEKTARKEKKKDLGATQPISEKDKKLATMVEPTQGIVGLVEDRPEAEGRHAHTSVAAAWRAPPSGQKPVFKRSLSGDVVEPSDNATFVCEVEHTSQYYVTWLKDNKVLDDKLADRILQQDEGNRHSLKLLHCQVEDSAIYTAKATDNNGVSATCSAQLLVHKLTPEEREARIAEKKPFFLVKMLPTEVIENTKLSYAVHVKGDPMPTVSFFKDGNPLKEDDRVSIRKDTQHGKYEILISHVQMSDAGSYKCSATNKFDKVECEAAMTVAEEQKALENLGGKGSLLQQGEKADFKWFRDGVEFDPVERFNVMFKDEEDTLALVFQNVTPDDAGIYTCVASTSCGKISCSAELTVEGSIKRLMKDPEPPKFEDELSDTHVAMAGTAMLECRISGYPKPDLSWTRDGVDVKIGGRIKLLWEDDENVTLIIKNISENDKGLYTVLAKNELGEAKSACKLIIRSPPKFRKLDKLVGCAIGQPFKCEIEVDGEPLPELKWLKDGREIAPSDHIKFESTPDGKFTMKIDKMKGDDCGNYSVVATNDMGQRADQFEIQADTPPEITRGLDSETEKKAGNDHTFEVRANGTPIPDATWFKDGKEISEDNPKYRITRDGNFYMLAIKDITRRDRGSYKIVLKNKNGTAQSEGNLLVRGPPEFIKNLDDACAKEGAKDIKMPVEWDANPRPAVKWFFKDKEINDENANYSIKTTDTSSVLTIKVASEEIVGEYSVKLSNEYGDRNSHAKFRLHEKPQILEPLQDVEFLEDERSVYKCKISGVPIPDIIWTKDGKKWSADEHRVITKREGDDEYYYMLIFEQAKTEDSAHYSAALSNVEGKVSTEGTIIVNTPPHITGSNFRDGLTFIAMHKLVLEVEASAVPEAEATWYCNGKELKEEEDSVKFSFDGKVYRMERIGSDPDQSGEYKLKLKNKIKEAEEKGTVTIIEKEARVRLALKDVNIKEKTDGKIQCQIVGDPIPTVQWLRDGKPIDDERIIITEDKEKRMHFLTFKNVEEEDKATFTVIGKNEHGQCETTCVMSVFVVPRPGELQDTVVDFGSDLLLNVHIHAIPPPEMTWFRNGKQLSEGDRVLYFRDTQAEIYSLQVKSVVLEDDGTYTYKAKNEVGECSGQSVVKIHTEEPTIVTHIEDQEICLEDEVTFTIKCAGLPPPDVEWKNKNAIVNKVERYTTEHVKEEVHSITLKDLVLGDYGTITAIARNLVGEAPSTAELIQKKLPCEVIKGLPNAIRGAEGDDVTLSVDIRASPRPQYVWTKNGDVVENSANIKISVKKTSYCEATISLTIIDSTSADTGQYRLRFYNEVNEAKSETAVNVQPERRKPNIKNAPEDLTLIEMDPAIFKVKVSGYPKPEVKWMKDGRIVRPTDILNIGMTAGNEYVMEFKNVTLEDAGKYTIVASNEEGVTESEFYLAVAAAPSKPKFIEGLKATNVISGYPCRFEIQLGGHPKPTVQWLKDGKPVEIDGNHIKQFETDDGRVILQIDNATDADAGEYSVVATNENGQNTSTAPLSVLDHDRKDGQDGPATFSKGLQDGTFDEGKTIRLPVGIRGGPDVPDMKWYKDGKELKLGDRVFFTYDGDQSYLEIHPCAGSDSGRYKCVIQNSNGSAETECDVTVRKCFESPSFTYTYPNQQKLPGQDAKFTVKVDGLPKPELSWFFNGTPIVADGEKFRLRKEADGCTLFVKDTTYSDTGSYKVVAKNKEGQTEHSANLSVSDDADPNRKFEAPNILKAIGDQELYENYTAKFKAVVSGRPEPEFEWTRNGLKLFPSNRILIERDEDGILRLSIKFVCEEDSGIYELKVWNDYGKASCKGKLICECISKHKKRPVGDEYKGFDKVRISGVPIPLPDPPIISSLSNRRCTLSWVPHVPAGPTIPVTYQVEYCECPNGDWITSQTGIRGNSVDIGNLAPKSDYKFRVRVENKFGVSEPSPYVNTYRNRLEKEPISHEPYLAPGSDSMYIDGPFVPSGFRLERDPRGNFFAPPRFMKLDHDTQYGMKNFSGKVKWVVYGYPTPKLKFFFKDEEIRFGTDKLTFKQESNGEVFLFIDKLTESDVGWYKCEAVNEYGESQQRIRLGLSEYPKVIEHLQETHIRSQTSGRIYCRISAYPPCNVTWFKDWKEITPSMKIRPQYIDPDLYCLNFSGVSPKDAGLYSIAAVNVAGAVSSSCTVYVEDDENTHNWLGYGRWKHVGINTKRGTLEDHYDIGDELGRGTQGVTYHCVERYSGNNFAAKSMWGTDQFKVWMHLEYDMMNLINSSRRIVRLYDAYEGPKNMVLVTDLCAGGELLHNLTQRQYITEYEIARYVKQVLEGLDYLHDRWMAHLGLNIGDLMVTRINGSEIKIGDLSLARNIRQYKLQPLEYGMPEFVAPEVAKGENVSYPADMWAVGIITYILLTGTSPFRGEHDRETLTRIQKGELRFDVDAFGNLSEAAKDFVAKLLQYKPENRMDVKSALTHPWMRYAEIPPHDPYKINTDRLRIYYSKYREWYANASCRRWYRRRPLSSAHTHPSKMVYPPGECYTPPESPEREVLPSKSDDFTIPHRDLSYEIGLIRNDSRYQQGPDTYLLQLRDTDFPVRLRKYMNLARERSPIAMFTGRDTSYDYERIPVVHERRRFTDIMDEEIDDERRRTMVDKYTSGFIRANKALSSLDLPKRVKQEITTRYTVREEAEAIKMEEKEEKGNVPFIREKPNTTSITPDMTLTLTCVVTGDPEPVVQWFRNDIILGDTERMAITCTGGRSQLYFTECKDFDVGFYKVVARNCNGQATHRFRIIRGEIPGMCDPPELEKVSGTQVLLRWRTPIDDGGAPIEIYNLQIKPIGEVDWKPVSDSIPQEIFLVENLTALKAYQFRVAAKNIRGWGEFSVSTPSIRTGNLDDPSLEVPVEQKLQQKNPKLQVLQLPGARGEIRDLLDYGREIQHVLIQEGEQALLQMKQYKMAYEISRGRFSSIMRCIRQDDQRTFGCKISLRRDREESVKKEYEIAKSLRHERLATMYEAYHLPEVTTFIIEYLGGPDILTFLSNKLQYTEQNVTFVVNQVLDAVSYLHWRGICHLDIQPDNVVSTSPNKVEVKLVDFGSAQQVARTGSSVEVNGLLDYIAPEVLFDRKAFPNSDVWSVGVLTYVLLTGSSPFVGASEAETLENIQCVRFKFETLGEKVSQEATRFLMLMFKRDPSKRPTEEECKDHKWLGENDFMVKKRERSTLSSTRLREYSYEYHKNRQRQASTSNVLDSYKKEC